jgi:hypothetical protein
MLAISVRQPWAWMIIHGRKDVENRAWPTNVRGRVLIHAAKTMTKGEWDAAWHFGYGTDAPLKAAEAGLTRANIERGGIIGSIEIFDCTTQCRSHWFMGPYGYLLRNPQPLPFAPWRGQLGFFDVPVQSLPVDARQALREEAQP